MFRFEIISLRAAARSINFHPLIYISFQFLIFPAIPLLIVIGIFPRPASGCDGNGAFKTTIGHSSLESFSRSFPVHRIVSASLPANERLMKPFFAAASSLQPFFVALLDISY